MEGSRKKEKRLVNMDNSVVMGAGVIRGINSNGKCNKIFKKEFTRLNNCNLYHHFLI